MPAATITVYDLSKHIFVSKELAQRYVINTENLLEMCKQNREIALAVGGREDVAHAWQMAEMIAAGLSELDCAEEDMFAGQNPFSRNLLESLIFHFVKIHDVQTAAMLCCAFGRHCPPPDQLYRTSSSGSKSVSQSVSIVVGGGIIWRVLIGLIWGFFIG